MCLHARSRAYTSDSACAPACVARQWFSATGIRTFNFVSFDWMRRFYNPNSDYDTAEKEELAEECKNSGEDEVIQERPVIAKFLVRTLAATSFCPRFGGA
jgi:hypothetical protein